MSETIGERLRRIRLAHGLTQRALAGDGVSHAHISRIEAGTRQPSVKAVRVLARTLGVSADYLETGVDRRLDGELVDAVRLRRALFVATGRLRAGATFDGLEAAERVERNLCRAFEVLGVDCREVVA
jgi:transcriptional regulator with XRE-family HTH domain